MTQFDFINAINAKGKKDIIRDSENPDLAEKSYNPWIINKGMSYYVDTIFYANEINSRAQVDKIMQNDYYINSIRPGKRYSKWFKKEEDSLLDLIMEYFCVGPAKAQEIIKVLTKEQLDLVKTKIIKGGNSNEFRSKQTDRGEII
jgi:hypothetical protein